MSDPLLSLFEGKTGAIVAALAGAAIRGRVGPGKWSWAEFGQAAATGTVLALWVAPGIAETFDLGEQAIIAVSVMLGMIGLPVARGIIALAIGFRRHPQRCLERLLRLRGRKE
jgi:hypothetical protein